VFNLDLKRERRKEKYLKKNYCPEKELKMFDIVRGGEENTRNKRGRK